MQMGVSICAAETQNPSLPLRVVLLSYFGSNARHRVTRLAPASFTRKRAYLCLHCVYESMYGTRRGPKLGGKCVSFGFEFVFVLEEVKVFTLNSLLLLLRSRLSQRGRSLQQLWV